MLPDAVLQFLLPSFLVSLSALWVYWDASGHKVGAIEAQGGGFSAGNWGVAVLLIWVVAFPMYLIQRGKLVRAALEAPVDSIHRGRKAAAFGSIPLVLGGVCLVAFVSAKAIPGCADSRTLDIVSSILQRQITTGAPSLQAVFDIEYTSVFSEGYEENAKRWTCRAQVRVTPSKALTNLVLEELTAARGNAFNVFAGLFGQPIYNAPDPELMKKGRYDIGISYRSFMELKEQRQMVEITAASGEDAALMAFAALAKEVSTQGGGAGQPGKQGETKMASSASSPAGSTEAQMNLQVKSFEICGPEAFCVYTEKGLTLRTNATTLDNAAMDLISDAAKKKGRVCFTDVSGAGTEYFFEGAKSGC